jgi:serine/threonine protein kinase
MPSYNSFDKELLFVSLTSIDIKSVGIYFENNKSVNKYSRKQSKFACSFMNTNMGLFAVSRHTVGSGSSGKVKVGKNVHTGDIVAVKIQLLNGNNVLDFVDNLDEPKILIQLGQLYTTTGRWWCGVLPNEGWVNKHEQESKYRTKKYNFKFYIFSKFFEGITLFKYFENYAPTLEKILRIVIKVLEKLEILNKQNMIHGDLSFSNILINKTPEGEIDINLIDFGLGGVLCNGIKKFPVIDYRFTKKSYVPPECDYTKVLYKVIPDLVTFKTTGSLALQEFYTINYLAREKYGFQTITSDLYSLGWGIYKYAGAQKDRTLRKLQRHTYIMDPFNREPLQLVTAKYKEQLINVTSKPLVYALNKASLNDSSSCGSVDRRSRDGLSNSSNGISSDSLDDISSSIMPKYKIC